MNIIEMPAKGWMTVAEARAILEERGGGTLVHFDNGSLAHINAPTLEDAARALAEKLDNVSRYSTLAELAGYRLRDTFAAIAS